MTNATTITPLLRAATRAYERKWLFLGVFVAVFSGNVFVLAHAGLLPDAPRPAAARAAPAVVVSVAPVAHEPEAPVRIEVAAIGLSAAVADPATTDAETLDGELLKGAVRYPTSALLGEEGNVVLFGHSSYLPIVGNQAYKTFDGIQKLVAGDIITVYSADAAYAYRVRGVAKENAESGAGISLTTAGKKVLTLVTCNSFATKSDRFIVTADFVESHPIPTS